MTLGRTTVNAMIICSLLAFSAPLLAADKLVLVEDGASRAPIIVFEDAPPKTMQAVHELADYIEKTSGARPEIIEGAPENVPQPAIWVGRQPQLEQLFPDVSFDFEHPEEIVIAANDRHLVIAGRDRWNDEHLESKRRGGTVTGVQQEYGTVNAIYTFLQDHLGVRWLWPGELGEDIAKRDTIAFEPFTYRYHPQIRSRRSVFRLSSLGDNRGLAQDWTRRQRLQLDSLGVPGGHAFTSWFDRFHEKHPDYFALQPDGTRDGFPSPRKAKLCQTNPAVWEQWIRYVESQLEQYPNRRVFDASPNDSYHRGICICEDCRAWDHPDGERVVYSWRGVAQEYVAMSDRYVTFANTLAKKLEQRFPGRDYYVNILAYGHSKYPPVEAEPADNVIISYVGGAPWKEQVREKIMRHLEGWAEVTSNISYRPNTGSPFGWQQGRPEVLMDKTIEDFKRITTYNVASIVIDTVWEHWGTQGPQYYIMAQMTWNSNRDGQAIMDDYYRRAFGPAAESMKAYWQHWERTRDDFVENPDTYEYHVGSQFGVIKNEEYTEQVLAKAESLLDEAEAQLTSDAPAKYKKRINYVRAGLTYTRHLIRHTQLVKRYRASNGQDTAAAEAAHENWAQVEALHEQHPNLLNSKWLRPGHNRVMPLPDDGS